MHRNGCVPLPQQNWAGCRVRSRRNKYFSLCLAAILAVCIHSADGVTPSELLATSDRATNASSARYAFVTGSDDRQGEFLVTVVYSIFLSYISLGLHPPPIYAYVPQESTESYRAMFQCLIQNNQIPQRLVIDPYIITIIPNQHVVCHGILRSDDSPKFREECEYNFARFFSHKIIENVPEVVFWMDADSLSYGNIAKDVNDMLSSQWLLAVKQQGRPVLEKTVFLLEQVCFRRTGSLSLYVHLYLTI